MLYEYAFTGSVGLIGVGPGALAAFEDDGIVVDVHVAAVYHDVGTGIDVDGIGRWSTALGFGSPNVLGGCIDVAVEEADVVTLVDVVGPEGRVDEVYVLNGDILRVGDVCEPWSLCVLVGALRVPLPSDPELLPVGQSVAVDGAFAGDGEAVEAVGIDESYEIGACLSLDASGGDGKVADAFGSQQCGALAEVQVSTLSEKQCSGLEPAWGHDNEASAVLCASVYHGLYLLCLHGLGSWNDAVVGEHILSSELTDVYLRRVLKPSLHGRPVWPGVGRLSCECHECDGCDGHYGGCHCRIFVVTGAKIQIYFNEK